MLTELGYVAAWAIYLLCAVMLYWGLGPIFRVCGPKVIQYFLRSFIVVILFTPAVSVPEQSLWAPAYLVALYGYIEGEEILATKAALFMAGGWCVIGLLLSLSYVFGKLRRSGTKASSQGMQSGGKLKQGEAQQGEELQDKKKNVTARSETAGKATIKEEKTRKPRTARPKKKVKQRITPTL